MLEGFKVPESEASEAYFARTSKATKFDSGGILGKGLYNCQEGALYAVLAHFSTTDNSAIVSMPTGSGKTELMCAICFLLGPRRVLILEPARHLRKQTAERFSALKVFREKGIVPESVKGPQVIEVKSIRDRQERWEELREYDVVVATPYTVSAEIKDISEPPDDELFDLILVDEGHHSAAVTWASVLEQFPNARSIHFTATPFRRDRRKIPGDLVYHYPLSKALEDGIYRPVEFVPSPFRNSEEELERALIGVAAAQINEERARNGRAIIRTDRIKEAERLVPLYKKQGVICEAIHSEVGLQKQKQYLGSLETGKLDALVCVGMLGEGLDLPALKIAVLHSPPQTLPQTLQLVGRVSRTTAGQKGRAYLIANPETVKGEVRRLYQEDVSWAEFVPQLVKEVLDEEYGDRLKRQIEDKHQLPILPEHLNPFCSVTLFKPFQSKETLQDRCPDLSRPGLIPGMRSVVEKAHKLESKNADELVVVTEMSDRPVWANKSVVSREVINTQYDLHIFYRPSADVMCVSTTSDMICAPLLRAIARDEDIEKIDPKFLPSILGAAERGSYTSVGLRNARGITGAHPTYKVNMGEGSGSSVLPSDGKVFGMGHAMAKMAAASKEVNNGPVPLERMQGIATRSRKAWQFCRASYSEFIGWCDSLAVSLALEKADLPGLRFLCRPSLVLEINHEPISIIVNEQMSTAPGILSVDVEEKVTVDSDRSVAVDNWELTDEGLVCYLEWHCEYPPLKVMYLPRGSKSWHVLDDRPCTVRSALTGSVRGLKAALNEWPPILIMPVGGAIVGDIRWEPNESPGPPPSEVLVTLDWTGCDIKKESRPPKPGKEYNVQGRVSSILQKEHIEAGDILVNDDAAGEIADFILIQPTRQTISLIHCKYSYTETASRNHQNVVDVLNQCCRSTFWVGRPDFLAEVVSRLKSNTRTSTKIEVGKLSDLQSATEDFMENQWKFKIVAAQPGTRIASVDVNAHGNIENSLRSAYEWIEVSGADFEFWGA